MAFNSGTLKHASKLWVLPLLMLTACGSTLDNANSTNNDGSLVDSTGQVSLSWTSDETKSGYVALNSSSVTMSATGLEGSEGYQTVCYNNNVSACRHAPAALVDIIGNHPTPITNFQLNFKKTGTTVITAASVTTAELRFNATTGEIQMGAHYTKQLTGTACTLTGNAVGYASTVGSEKILVGLQIYDDALNNGGGQYTNATLTAGRVTFTGLYPAGTATQLGYKYKSGITGEDFATQDFGIDGFTSTTSSAVLVSPVFGVDASDEGEAGFSGAYEDHVIVGICLNGTKSGGSRPLAYYMKAYQGIPKLKRAD